MIIKDLNRLNKKVKELCEKFINECKNKDITVIITETFRDKSRQEQAVIENKSNAHFGYSFHNYGLAFDFAVLNKNKGITWNVNKDKNWFICGEIGKKLGLSWGGDWKMKDYCHFEFYFNINRDVLLNKLLKGFDANKLS